jgi:IclR family pca regulon transcriptional regulator
MVISRTVIKTGAFAIAKADMIEGMAKGMAVLESFDTQRQRLNATLAAERAGITRAAARRHLLTLTHLGYLETDGSYFWLAPKVLRFSGSYLATARLPRAIQPALNRLAAQTQESFSVAVLDGDEIVIIGRSGFEWKSSADGKSAPARVLAYGLHLGARLPAHATSTGRILLAAKTKSEVNAWLKTKTETGNLARLTLHTTTDPRKLKALVEQVRATTTAWPAKSMSWACTPWPCRCATCRGTRWPRSMWCRHRSGCGLRPCSGTAALAAGCGEGIALLAVALYCGTRPASAFTSSA